MKRKLLFLLIFTTLLLLPGCKDSEESLPEETTETEETITEEKEYAVDKLDRSDEGYTLVWNDEFDGDSLDTTKWCMMHGNGSDYGIENWGNSELESYEYDNVAVENGELVITAKREDKNGKQFTSGRLRTMTDDGEPLFSVKYGRIEAKIKVEGGSGIWPAFWMLPADTSTYGTWAASGELDIFEAKGRLPMKFCGTAHYGSVWPNNVYSTEEYFFDQDTSINDYHTYALEWTPTSLKWYVDDECYETLTNWYASETSNSVNYTAPAPFDVPFYIILNLAVGGTFDSEGAISDETFPAAMYVDFVRVYQLDEGYDDSNVKAAYNTAVKKETGHTLYNASFDEGVGRLAFWNIENLDASVPGYVIDSEGNEDYSRAVELKCSEEVTEGSMSQSGLAIAADSTYGVKFDISADAETPLRIEIKDGDNVLVSKETTVPALDYMSSLKFTFDSGLTEDTDNATLYFYVGQGGTVKIDNIILQNITE